MKHRLAIITAAFLLTSCGGGSSDRTGCETDYWDGTVGTCLPSGWETLDQETLRQRGVPEETIVVFQSEESVSGQFPTVAVTRERLASEVGSTAYSDANIRSIEVIDGYKHIDTKEKEVAGEKVSLHTFSAQPIEGEPRRRYYQVSLTEGDVGYTVTAVSPVSIGANLEKKMMVLIENFTLDEPVVEE